MLGLGQWVQNEEKCDYQSLLLQFFESKSTNRHTRLTHPPCLERSGLSEVPPTFGRRAARYHLLVCNRQSFQFCSAIALKLGFLAAKIYKISDGRVEVRPFDTVANTLAKSWVCRSLGRLDHGPSSQANIVFPSGGCFVEGFMLAHVYFHARRVERSFSSKQVLV